MRKYLAFICLGAFGCVTTSTPKTPPSKTAHEAFVSQLPKTLAPLFEREATQLTVQTITGPKEQFSFQVAISAEPSYQASEDIHVYSLPITSGQPLNCYVKVDRLDSATLLKNLFGLVKNNPVVTPIIHNVTAHVHKHIPYYLAETYYTGEQNKQKVAGLVKYAVVSMPKFTAYCLHDEPGYRETFHKTVKSIIASFSPEHRKQLGDIASRQVLLDSVNGKTMGWTESWLDMKNGRSVSYDTSVLVTSPTSFQNQDTVKVTVFDKEEIIGMLRYYKSADDVSDLTFVRSDDGSYKCSGKFKDQDLDVPVQNAKDLRLGAETRLTRMILEGSKSKGSEKSLLPSVDPTKAHEITYELIDKNERKFRSMFGELEMILWADECGNHLRSEISVGPATIVTESVSYETFGEFKDKCLF